MLVQSSGMLFMEGTAFRHYAEITFQITPELLELEIYPQLAELHNGKRLGYSFIGEFDAEYVLYLPRLDCLNGRLFDMRKAPESYADQLGNRSSYYVLHTDLLPKLEALTNCEELFKPGRAIDINP